MQKCFNNPLYSMIQIIIINDSESLGHLKNSTQNIWMLCDISLGNWKVCVSNYFFYYGRSEIFIIIFCAKKPSDLPNKRNWNRIMSNQYIFLMRYQKIWEDHYWSPGFPPWSTEGTNSRKVCYRSCSCRST